MKTASAVLAGTLVSVFWGVSALAQAPCVPSGASVPPGANTTDKSAPFYLDVTGLDLTTTPPTRNPHSANYPPATDLPDGVLPPAGAEGNFVIGPTHKPAPETVAQPNVPHGKLTTFTMASKDSVIFNPGVIRDDPPGCRNGSVYAAKTMPGDPSALILTTPHPASWTRSVDVYVPARVARGKPVPFLVFGDGGANGSFPGRDLFTVLDNLIAQHRVPPFIAIGIAAGGQDAPGSERGREYDTVSGAYTAWVEQEVLPLVERNAGVRLTRDPEGRATMGISSSGAAAFAMAWFHPELYHRVLAYSPTMVSQQWPRDPALRGGAWEFHSAWTGPAGPAQNVELTTLTPAAGPSGAPLIPNNPRKPIRFWFETGDQDNFYTAPNPDGMHDWALANENMARVLAAKGYHYQFVFARNARHVDRATVAQTLPAALEWLWKGYPAH